MEQHHESDIKEILIIFKRNFAISWWDKKVKKVYYVISLSLSYTPNLFGLKYVHLSLPIRSVKEVFLSC